MAITVIRDELRGKKVNRSVENNGNEVDKDKQVLTDLN